MNALMSFSVGDVMIKIGDTVTIVSAKGCRFGYDHPMSGYIGMEAIVNNLTWRHGVKAYSFSLDVDGGRYAWCDKCIEPASVAEIDESDVPIDSLFGGVVV